MTIIKTLIWTILVPGSITIGIPYLLLSSGLRRYSFEIGAPRFLGIGLIALGAVFYLWCAWDFAIAGKGTPAPLDPPKLLVRRGLYRLTRNPIYLGVLLLLIGETILFESLTLLAYALVLWIVFHLFVISYEEPTLKRQFGGAYDEYCSAVPRWVPSLKRAKRESRQ